MKPSSPVDLRTIKLDDEFANKLSEKLPSFLQSKTLHDGQIYIKNIEALRGQKVNCVTSYRQGFGAALEYIREYVHRKPLSENEEKEKVLDANKVLG